MGSGIAELSADPGGIVRAVRSERTNARLRDPTRIRAPSPGAHTAIGASSFGQSVRVGIGPKTPVELLPSALQKWQFLLAVSCVDRRIRNSRRILSTIDDLSSRVLCGLPQQPLEHWLRVLVQVHRTASKDFTTQDELDRAIETLSTSTMGTVFAALRALVNDPRLEAELTEAVAERNRLAHQYFGQWAESWDGVGTEVRMIQDADRVRALFAEAVKHLITIIRQHLDTIGTNPDEYIPGLSQRISDVMARDGE